jgi:hypothetical protein
VRFGRLRPTRRQPELCGTAVTNLGLGYGRKRKMRYLGERRVTERLGAGQGLGVAGAMASGANVLCC